MKLESADQLDVLLWKAIVDQFATFQNELEIRIANVLRIHSDLGPQVVIAIAQGVSRDMSDSLLDSAFKSGQLRDSLHKLL